MHLYLIRHAEPESGTDPQLAANGGVQAEKLGDMFARVNNIAAKEIRVLTSTLNRSKQTGELIRQKLNVPVKKITIPPPTATETTSGNVERLMTQLRVVASGLMPVLLVPPSPKPRLIIVVWHHPNIGAALNWLVGNNLLEWPNIYGVTAHVECSDSTFGQGTGKLRWFILPDMLP